MEPLLRFAHGMRFALIPAGEFTMDEGGDAHKARLTRPFHMAATQVTQRQYEAVTGKNPSRFKGADNPVERASWNDATEFCKKLSTRTGNTVRLPTEAEWEYACRAGSTGKYCFGDEESRLGEFAWYDRNSDRKTHPVGRKKPNAWGLYDMHGNVWEWCQDYYADHPSGAVTDPTGPSSGTNRVLRGGSWDSSALAVRSALRGRGGPAISGSGDGFRVVLAQPVGWQQTGERKMDNPHEANRAVWNGWAKWWGEEEDKKGVWQRCHRDPTLMLCTTEIQFLGDMRGKRACVLASGNNMVVLTLAGMGAEVTSVDISEGQLRIARERASFLGLDITFLRSDVTELTALEDDTFDVVYTGGGVDIWMSDLSKYYAEAARILGPGGVFIVNDGHPIRRLFGDDWDELEDYSDRGPFTYTSNEGFRAYEYHWKVADHIQAAIDAGCTLLKVEERMESPAAGAEGVDAPKDDGKDGEAAKVARLPSHLLLVMTKH